MQLTSLVTIAAALILPASAKNILLTNDDGWAATNLRAFYRDLKAAGHTVVAVAPAVQYSGNGGRFIIPETATLEQDASFSYPALGAPAWGHEKDDQNIWYFNGSPAACVSMGLDYVIPTFFDNMTIDLVVGGPNEGTNMGERDFYVSGTIGSAYYAVERGYPAIAFSGSDGNNSFFKDNLDGDPEHSFNIYSKYAVEIVNLLLDNPEKNKTLLPLATGLNVNFPSAGKDLDSNCSELTFKHTRFTGSNSLVYKAEYNETTSLITQKTLSTDSVQNCVAGNCTLPDEFTIIQNGQCEGTITVFTIDLDTIGKTDEQVLPLFESVLS